MDDIGSISSWSIGFGPTALPLELLRFEGRVFEGYNSLEWETASEKNTAFFEVQRSTDGSDYTLSPLFPPKGKVRIHMHTRTIPPQLMFVITA